MLKSFGFGYLDIIDRVANYFQWNEQKSLTSRDHKQKENMALHYNNIKRKRGHSMNHSFFVSAESINHMFLIFLKVN